MGQTLGEFDAAEVAPLGDVPGLTGGCPSKLIR
jgi:hypothetical protein